MLSTQYRLRLQAICKDIAAGTEVTLEDMIWAEKLSKANTSARGMLVQQEDYQLMRMDLVLNT